jgi:hypothetical protein
MSDTPETDALREAIDNGKAAESEMTSLAGKLERECDKARTELGMWRDGNILHEVHYEELNKQLIRYDALFDESEKIRIERDKAREALSEWEDAAKDIDESPPHNYVFHCECVPIFRKLLAEAKQERDEARLQYSTTLVFCQSFLKARLEQMEVAGE